MPTNRDHTFSSVVWAWPGAAGLKEGTGKMAMCVIQRLGSDTARRKGRQ